MWKRAGELKGMGLLPIQTVFAGEKMRTRVQGTFEGLSGSLSSLSQVPLEGYEIHMGVTTYTEEPCPLVQIQEETGERRIRYDGARKNNCYGCYVHGILIGACVASGFVSALLKKKGYDAGQLEASGLEGIQRKPSTISWRRLSGKVWIWSIFIRFWGKERECHENSNTDRKQGKQAGGDTDRDHKKDRLRRIFRISVWRS